MRIYSDYCCMYIYTCTERYRKEYITWNCTATRHFPMAAENISIQIGSRHNRDTVCLCLKCPVFTLCDTVNAPSTHTSSPIMN